MTSSIFIRWYASPMKFHLLPQKHDIDSFRGHKLTTHIEMNNNIREWLLIVRE